MQHIHDVLERYQKQHAMLQEWEEEERSYERLAKEHGEDKAADDCRTIYESINAITLILESRINALDDQLKFKTD